MSDPTDFNDLNQPPVIAEVPVAPDVSVVADPPVVADSGPDKPLKKNYTDEVKAEAVQRVLYGEKKVVVAQAIGTSEQTISNWVNKAQGKVAKPQSGNTTQTEAELIALKAKYAKLVAEYAKLVAVSDAQGAELDAALKMIGSLTLRGRS